MRMRMKYMSVCVYVRICCLLSCHVLLFFVFALLELVFQIYKIPYQNMKQPPMPLISHHVDQREEEMVFLYRKHIQKRIVDK